MTTTTFVTTENNATSLSSTGDARCDLFFKSVRGVDNNTVFDMCDAAWEECPLDVLKIMLYTRDCERGKGERRVFYDMMLWLWSMNEECMADMLCLLVRDEPHFGYWKDLLNLLCVMDDSITESVDLRHISVYHKVAELFADQLRKDMSALDCDDGDTQQLSLCAKYAPTKNGAHDKRLRMADAVAKRWFPNEKCYQTAYRKALHRLRERLRVPEVLFCENRWDELRFDKMPGLCMYRHTEAFQRHCPSEWEAYMEDVANRKKEMNVRMLYPYEILMPYLKVGEEIPLEGFTHVEMAWANKVGEVRSSGKLRRRILPICDVSGSMFCEKNLPIANSVSLGLLISEASEGPFQHTVITFSETPRMLDLSGCETLLARLRMLVEEGTGFNTDFVKVFKMLLHHMRAYGVAPENAPEVLMCISDMQFDEAVSGHTNFQHVREMYAEAGYALPEIWFWNVRGKTVDFPVNCYEENVSLVSGFSPSVVDLLVEGDSVTPYKVMRGALDNERYDCAEHVLQKNDLNVSTVE